ncbi:MAG: hypothetical protein IKO01_09715 [Kiritimatiellae bacterium]|nr:hypothetical protein [Kiritimatiellia bacterium]
MSCPVPTTCILAAAFLLCCQPAAEAEWRGGTVLEFAGGRVTCIVEEDGGDALAAAAGIGMAAALRLLPPPDAPATVTVRLLAPPPFYKRWLGGTAAAPHGYQSGGEIAVRPESDRVKLAFRLGHEATHWLVARTHPWRPPLWLDEGLAQLVGARAAAAAGRTEKRGLARTPPDGWEACALSLDALASATAYGDSPAAAGAFYWQAERLVDALFERLGRDDFLEYLSLLSSPGAPAWQEPLRARWWFNDADFDALARTIAPTQPMAP